MIWSRQPLRNENEAIMTKFRDLDPRELNPGFSGRNFVFKTLRHILILLKKLYNASVAGWFNNQVSATESRV